MLIDFECEILKIFVVIEVFGFFDIFLVSLFVFRVLIVIYNGRDF